jgi:hypothetical protein
VLFEDVDGPIVIEIAARILGFGFVGEDVEFAGPGYAAVFCYAD